MSKCSLQVTKTPSESTTILNFFLVALIPGMISEWSQQMRSWGTGDETNCEVLEHKSDMRSCCSPVQSAKVYLRSNDSLRENTSQIAFVADGSCANSQYRRNNAEVCSDGLLQNALTARVQRILFENLFAGRENWNSKMGGKNLTFPAEKQRFASARHTWHVDTRPPTINFTPHNFLHNSPKVERFFQLYDESWTIFSTFSAYVYIRLMRGIVRQPAITSGRVTINIEC